MRRHHPQSSAKRLWATLLAATVLGTSGCHYSWVNTIREHHAFVSTRYYNCPQCGEVVSKSHYHECPCPQVPGCYGYNPTCWRAWPECCEKCPPPASTVTGVPVQPVPAAETLYPAFPEAGPVPPNAVQEDGQASATQPVLPGTLPSADPVATPPALPAAIPTPAPPVVIPEPAVNANSNAVPMPAPESLPSEQPPLPPNPVPAAPATGDQSRGVAPQPAVAPHVREPALPNLPPAPQPPEALLRTMPQLSVPPHLTLQRREAEADTAPVAEPSSSAQRAEQFPKFIPAPTVPVSPVPLATAEQPSSGETGQTTGKEPTRAPAHVASRASQPTPAPQSTTPRIQPSQPKSERSVLKTTQAAVAPAPSALAPRAIVPAAPQVLPTTPKTAKTAERVAATPKKIAPQPIVPPTFSQTKLQVRVVEPPQVKALPARYPSVKPATQPTEPKAAVHHDAVPLERPAPVAKPAVKAASMQPVTAEVVSPPVAVTAVEQVPSPVISRTDAPGIKLHGLQPTQVDAVEPPAAH